MSKKYLFVAEADKIQDLVFRSSKLREVSGGSQMLTEFCDAIAEELPKIQKFNVKDDDIVISSGGSFRILFDSKDKAEEFGEYLSEMYRRELGGTVTIAEPVEVYKEKDAIVKGQENLRKAKHSGKPPTATEQMPYIAICSSCGIGIARYYKRIYKDEQENYFCKICEEKSKKEKLTKGNFLSHFRSCIKGEKQKDIEFPSGVDEVVPLEPRGYVAYIVADVNNMGVIFSSCDSFDKLKKLSESLSRVIQESLAEPTKTIMEKQLKDLSFVPVLPLILGGDDVFVLIPARWSIDFTRRFCEKFEEKMKQSLKKIDLATSTQPTISASVIICKGKFPYLIAHSLGEELLKKAKKTSKEKKTSAISFRVITGNEVVKAPERKKKFIASFPAYTIKELEKLIDYRRILKDLPGTRRAHLESLFYEAERLSNDEEMKSEWFPKLRKLLERLDTTQRKFIEQALNELGDPSEDYYWQDLQELDDSYCHKLPDLLSAWDFTYDVNIDSSDYEVAEEKK